MKTLKNNKGFSLVELMVVVAIIGILSSIAIPSINKYIARARQSEAKANLSLIYTSNKAFFAEYNLYDSRFDVIGYRPEGQLRYNIGFATASATNLQNYGYTAPISGGGISSSRAFCASNATMCTTMEGAGANPGPNTQVQANLREFTAGAAGRIGAGAQEDRWTITQSKLIENTQDGTN